MGCHWFPGSRTLKLEYSKDSSEEDGDDCGWVDFVQWTGPSPEQYPSNFQTINYKDDVYGRRSEKKVDGYGTRYLYDGPHVIAEYDGNNNLLRKYIYGPGIDQPVCMIEVADSNAVYYYHFDALGSVVALSDSSGDTVQTYEYSVYGQVAVEDINHPNPYMFAGRRFDIEIGLYYNRARYYNPYTGRFLQIDPAGDGMNSYAYCANSPVGWTDPYGLVKSFEELPRNTGARKAVSIAFYNGSAPGYWTDAQGQTHTNAGGAQFKEAADDFVVPVGGDTYALYFDIGDVENLKDLTTFIEKRLNGLKMYGYDVTDIYFFDHSGGGEDVDGLYFGENVYITASEIAKYGKDLTWNRILPKSATVHFRQCYVGGEDNRDLLKNLATWTNRTVTGGTGMTTYSYPWGDIENVIPNPYDPGWEQGGVDYTYGSLWGAGPGGTPYEIWPEWVDPTLYEKIVLGWGPYRNTNQPY
jgi:RHS repeat-associated protein